MLSSTNSSRRSFIKQAAIGSAILAAAPYSISAQGSSRVAGANDRIRVALIGCNRRFFGVGRSVCEQPNVEVVWVCDVDSRRQDAAVNHIEKHAGYRPKAEKDMRKIYEDDSIDAIFQMTPDHWHALGTVLALQAGKHVYVEKPCSHNLFESDLLIKAQKKYGKVVQMGNQQRSSAESQEIIRQIHEGVIGNAYMATAFYCNNRGRVPDANNMPPPEWLDWELFQGPAPRQDFVDILADYMWHWYWAYGTGETGNNATHELDIARWALNVDVPDWVQVNSGKYHYTDDPWTMYDTMDATFHFHDGKCIKWDGKSRNGQLTYGAGRGTIIYGTEGSVFIDRGGYRLYDRHGELVREQMSGGDETGTALGGGGNLTTRHVRNFFEAIRGNEEQASPISEGALSTDLCHYANISSRAGNRKLEIDPKTGRINDRGIMKKYWSREYERGWEPKI